MSQSGQQSDAKKTPPSPPQSGQTAEDSIKPTTGGIDERGQGGADRQVGGREGGGVGSWAVGLVGSPPVLTRNTPTRPYSPLLFKLYCKRIKRGFSKGCSRMRILTRKGFHNIVLLSIYAASQDTINIAETCIK